MDWNYQLPGGCKNLNDVVRLVDRDATVFAPMTLLRAQSLAAERKAELICIASGNGMPTFRLVDATVRKRIGTGE